MGLGSKSWNKIKSGGNNLWEFDKKIYGSIFNPLSTLKGDKKPSVDQASTLTPEQQAQLSALSAQNIANYPHMYSALGSLAYNPESNYSKIGNWEGEFNAGVFNPAMNQMNKMIDNTRHSSNLHSSANRYAQDQLRQGLSDQLAGLRYDQLMKERSMQLQGLDDAQQRQMSALGALNNLSGQALGVNGVENIVSKNRDWMDYASLGISGLSALGGLAGAGA